MPIFWICYEKYFNMNSEKKTKIIKRAKTAFFMVVIILDIFLTREFLRPYFHNNPESRSAALPEIASQSIDLRPSTDKLIAEIKITPAPKITPTPISTLVAMPTSETIAPAIVNMAAELSPVPASESGIIKMIVPFTSQAPFGEWSDPRQEDACEEASSLMAIYWTRGIASISQQTAKKEILSIVAWEEDAYNNYQDTSTYDTAKIIFNEHFGYSNVWVEQNINSQDIITELESGNLVIVPLNGRALNNPHFTQPGPERHMLVIIGYDYNSGEFITNDPGTKYGQDYRYGRDLLFNAIRDYPSSIELSQILITGESKNMIVVSPL